MSSEETPKEINESTKLYLIAQSFTNSLVKECALHGISLADAAINTRNFLANVLINMGGMEAYKQARRVEKEYVRGLKVSPEETLH